MSDAATNDSSAGWEDPRPFSVFQATVLQILPGIANLVVFVPVAYLMRALELPVIFALGAGLLFAEVPVSWLFMILRVRLENGGRFSFAVAFPWRRRIPVWMYLVLGVPAAVLSTALLGAVFMPFSESLRTAYFAWVPDWLLLTASPEDLSDSPRDVLIAMWVMSLTVLAGLGGVTQELYARGFLMPRSRRLGLIGAPLLNAVNFAVMHLIAPWSWPGFFVVAYIWALLVWFTRSVKIGLFAHVGMLLIQSLGLGLIAFGVVKLP